MGQTIETIEQGLGPQTARRPRPRAALRIAWALLIGLSTSGCGYNTMVAQQEAVDAAWSEVENQLQRRNDLIPNLVSTVKGFAGQEREVLTAVTQARNRIEVATDRGEQIAAANALSASLSRLVGVVERYPELKSNENFLRLQDSLEGTENRLAVARMRYNDAVRAYNTTIRRFPTNLMAGVFGFEPETYFEAPEAAREVPTVEF